MKPTLNSTTLLDRLSQRRGDAAFIAGLADREDARFLVLTDGKPVIFSNEERTRATLRWFAADDLGRARLDRAGPLFLGVDRVSGAGRFALAFSDHKIRTSPFALELMRPAVDLRSLAAQGIMSPDELSLIGMAKALAHWHESARCCGRCGAVMLPRDGGWKRKCWACGNEQFPRTDPVVIMMIRHPDRQSCLLGRAPRFAEGMFSTLAGFVEPGEDIEDAVRRETLEETGVEV
ncbi:MAG: NAD(+) diphosphatase, partial [Hyphomicrobiaceae bacterium]